MRIGEDDIDFQMIKYAMKEDDHKFVHVILYLS
jgi:hypothetical protein